MISLAQNLKQFLEAHFVDARKNDSESAVRPILIGPPDTAMEALFDQLTSAGTTDWQLSGPQQLSIPVLLVTSRSDSAANVAANAMFLSRRCQWDYAVTVRNSCPLALMLATPSVWDNRPESLRNTTETLGSPTGGRGRFRDTCWKYLVDRASAAKGVGEALIRFALHETTKQAESLESSVRERVAWVTIDTLLGPTPAGLVGDDIVNAAAGFPAIGSSGLTVSTSANILKGLSAFLGKHGLNEGIDKLRSTNSAQVAGLEADFDALLAHLGTTVLSASDFERAPAWHYRPGDPVPGWWSRLSATRLEAALEEADDRPRVKLSLSCENALNASDKLPGEPLIVSQLARLRASAPGSAQVTGATFSRKVDRSSPVLLPADPVDPGLCIDASPTAHKKPVRYTVAAANANPGTLDVLALDMFGCGGTLHVRDADKNPPPAFTKGSQTWSQHIVLRRSGASEVRVYHAAAASLVKITLPGETPREQSTIAGSSFVTFNLDLEDNSVAEISLSDPQGIFVGAWTATFSVPEVTDVAKSRFDALVQEHRTGRRNVPRPEDTVVQRLEGSAYLASSDSWKPVLACWSSEHPGWIDIDWSTAKLGDVEPQIDPRPTISPPPAVLTARESLRQSLVSKQLTIGEIELSDPAVLQLVDCYLAAYMAWLDQAPAEATWIDSLAIHSSTWNSQAGRYIPSDEPVVILLAPLHPLRLGWQCVAQQQLTDALASRCPAAGILDPSRAPDVGAWNFNTGQGTAPRAFLSVPCKNPHWAILLNHMFLNQNTERVAVLKQVSALGLDVQGIAGGFTVPQAIDSLQEVARLLPARATMRVGLVGTPESSTACADGVIEWCKGPFETDTEEVRPYHVDVFDTREATDPSPEQLAALSETTSERVKWFKLGQNATAPRLDLTIIDQLGAHSPMVASGAPRSATGHGGLYRLRIRQDSQNAKVLSESRVGRKMETPTSFADRVREAIQKFETRALTDNDSSQFRFRPNQDAIGNRLANSTFLAVTSSQIDPACVVRGVSGQSGYLWDYELPGVLGGPESNVGYYLLAKPLEAMRAAVRRSASLIVSSPPDPVSLLDEISRHGIPILKRLASGGTQSRGELGLLLAVRLLQDVFRGNATAPRLPVWKDKCIHLVLPVDPYEEPFELIRRELCRSTTTPQRPDLLVIAIYMPQEDQVLLKLTPVEVKFRGGSLPSSDARAALRQAENLGKIVDAAWRQSPQNDLWATCSRALLGECLDFGFRIYADPAVHGHTTDEWTRIHEGVLQAVLDGRAQLTINVAGRLLAFDNSATTSVIDMDGDKLNDSAIFSPEDAKVLLSGVGDLSPQGESAVSLLDFSFPWCADNQGASSQSTASGNKAQVPTPQEAAASSQPPTKNDFPDAQPAGEEAVSTVSADTRTRPGPVQPLQTIPPATRQRVRDAFSGFIGNEPAVARLTNDLLRALMEKPPYLSKNYLFTGLPSTGKTELSRRVAVVLGLPFVKLDGRSVVSRERLFELINGELNQQALAPSQVGQQVGLPVMDYPPLIVFIDEIHLVAKGLQEALLTMLEAADRTVVLSKQVALMGKTTFLFATTRASDVDAAFVTRCDEVQLREYTEEEVAKILAHKNPHDWPAEIYSQLARLGRCVPRVAIQLADALETAVMVAEHPKELSAHLEDVRRAREIDENGLTPMDIAYLNLLERSNRPVGEQVVLNMLRTVDKDRILNEIEPFLGRLGFIKHGPQGREITATGKSYILDRRREGAK